MKQLKLGIKEPFFDLLRRGVKTREYRPRTTYYLQRFEGHDRARVTLGHQGMTDKLECVFDISIGAIPEESKHLWYKLYDHDHRDVYFLDVVGIPRHYQCQNQIAKGYPSKFA
jgi:hypothetical protein